MPVRSPRILPLRPAMSPLPDGARARSSDATGGSMIDLYLWTTDNGYKARHAMEESGLEHRLKPLDFRKREQFAPEFLKISPGHKIPAIVDHDGPGGKPLSLFESGAILKYLGTKAGN